MESCEMEKTIQIAVLLKSYDGKKVIENLSFSVAAGEVYGLLGANDVGYPHNLQGWGLFQLEHFLYDEKI